MKCLVLGGNGFLGKNLCKELLSDGYCVRVFDRPVIDRAVLLNHIEFFEGDFTNEQDLEQAIQGCNVIFHLISTTLPKSSNENPVYDIESNLVSTVKMLLLAKKHGIKKVIFTSSGGTIYGVPQETPIKETHPTNPICSYGINKLSIEKYLYLFDQLHDLNYTILRISNPYGEGQKLEAMQGAVGVFIGKALRKESVEIWGDGEVIRDYIHVSDVSNALIKAMLYDGEYRLFNIGSHEGISLNCILATIEKVMNTNVHRIYKAARDMDVRVNILDNKRAKDELKWQPKVSFLDGIRRTIHSVKTS